MAWNRRDRNEMCTLMNNIMGRSREYWKYDGAAELNIIRRFPDDTTNCPAQEFTDEEAEQWLDTHITGLEMWLKAAKNLKKSINLQPGDGAKRVAKIQEEMREG